MRQTREEDASAILQMIGDSGQCDADGLKHVQRTLTAHLGGRGHEIWLTADDSEPVGVAYCAPEPVAPGVWNLLMLWTRPDRHGRGHGAALLQEVERLLLARKARPLIVETSSLPDSAPARKFYAKSGSEHEASIKNYFAEGDDKLIFTKSLAASTA